MEDEFKEDFTRSPDTSICHECNKIFNTIAMGDDMRLFTELKQIPMDFFIDNSKPGFCDIRPRLLPSTERNRGAATIVKTTGIPVVDWEIANIAKKVGFDDYMHMLEWVGKWAIERFELKTRRFYKFYLPARFPLYEYVKSNRLVNIAWVEK